MSKILPEYREKAKKRIIEAGLEVMYEKGYCNTTMEDIARCLDVSKPALYRYFKNKDELVIESANYLQTQYRDIKTGCNSEYRDIKTGCNSDICPVDAWIEIFDQIMSPDIKIHALYFEILGMTVHKPEVQKRSIEGMKRGLDQPTHEIEEQQQKGLIPSKTDPRTLAIALVSLFNGMRVLILLGVDWKEVRSRWIEILRNLFGITEKGGQQAECPRDCKRFEDCNPASEI
ncbi:Transcriptional regulator, TetR family [Methanosarcina barkeri str. Wiesmoor]|uniref:Transcriptional regulator, TetR family n=2 Tax=Methanosarcina barkeri TaxID=2208 RepID=A0A0E3QLW0_METBA|nr:Transcriptional regulator, TetR family [Methanosarcina barkeri str. Wiesmoor]